MNVNQLPPVYDDCKATLKETSKDDAGAYFVSDSHLEVYNFDEVKEKYYQEKQLPMGEMISSCDALYIHERHDNEIYLIEFRNMIFANLVKGRTRGEIKEKLSGSLLLLTDIIRLGISETREVANFLLVYNGSKGRFEAEALKRSNLKSNEFNLEKYENIYYKQCLILDKKEFQKRFVDQWEADGGA